MVNEQKELFYIDKINDAESVIIDFSKKLTTIVRLRLVVFLAVAIAAFFLWKVNMVFAIILINIAVLFFLFLGKRQSKLETKKIFYSNLKEVYLHEVKLLNRDFVGIDEGNRYQEEYHNYSHDLDMFGVNSIYQILNRCCTFSGKEKLSNLLNHPFSDKDKIINNQLATKELFSKQNWCHDFLAYGKGVSDNSESISSVEKWLNSENYFSGSFTKVIKQVVPILMILMIAALILGVISWIYLGGFFLLNLIITSIYTKRVNKVHTVLSSKYAIIEKYIDLIKSIEIESFSAKNLSSLQKQILVNKDEISASSSLKKLNALVGLLDARLNIYMALLLNGFFLWDINNASKVEKWRGLYKAEFIKWIDAIGEFDVLVSLALFNISNKEYIYPEILEGDFKIKTQKIGHPLISKEKLVLNDYEIEGDSKIDLLTGANMAGKSTFLRTLGVNLILSMIGAPVCAQEFKCKPVKLFTSLRTVDSLQENESFFYAELKRLREMILLYEGNNDYFFLFDEILKGTNSKDQHSGSLGLIKKILSLKGKGIIATHDLELSILEQELPENIRNFSFEVDIVNDKLKFDYKLKRGFCKMMNATYLMKNMGII